MEQLCDLVKGITCETCPFGSIVYCDQECPSFRSSIAIVHYLNDVMDKSKFVIDKILNGETEDR